MAGIDTSIYSQIAAPPDPFAVPNKLLGLQQGALGLSNTQIENQLLRRRLAGDQALQSALSDATDPATGQIDTNKLVGGLRGTPGAERLPAAIQEGQHIVGGNIANTGAAQNLNTAQISTVGNIFGAGLQSNPNYGRRDALGDIVKAVSSGQITPALGNTLMHQLPRDDAGAKAWANEKFVRTLPSAGAQPTQIGVTPGGAPVTGTAAQVITKSVGAVPTNANGEALNPDGTPTSGNLNPKTGIVTPPRAKPGQMGYVSGLAPGQAEASNVDQQAAANQAAAFERQANGAADNKATIANMQDQLSKVATGPYADRINTAKAGYNELVDASGVPLPQFDKSKIAALDEFRKNGQILANQQFATLGGTGTDAQLNAAIHSNPGTFMSNLSNKQILQMLQGNQDAIEAKATAWRQYKQANGAAANFNTFSEDFNRSYSPRAFQFVHMTPEERKDMVKNMTPVEKSQLNSALQTAMDRGWINKPGASQ